MKKRNNTTLSALQFFGYRYPPFADTFEINEPYQSEAEGIIAQRTTTLLRQGKSIAIHGEAGSGKSMFAKSIATELDPKDFRIAYIPYAGMKPSALLRDLCDELDIDTAGRKNLLSRIANDFKRAAAKPFPIIVVDEAHEMSRQSFIDLCSLLHDARQRTAAASLLLIGQPILKKMLELDVFAAVKTRLACMMPMPKLTIDDAREFIAYRLELAHADPGLFDREAVECLAADAKGNRRMLMNLAALCLEEAARRNDKVITTEIVTAVSLEYQL